MLTPTTTVLSTTKEELKTVNNQYITKNNTNLIAH